MEKGNLKKVVATVAVGAFLLGNLTAFAASNLQEVKAWINYDLKMKLNGKTFSPTESDGTAIRPLTYNNRTYLPVSALGNALGVAIGWDGETKTVIIGEGDKITSMVKDYRTKGFSPLIKRRLVIGSYVLQKENQDRYYLNACKVRRLVVDTFNKLFEKYDGFITMASGGAAPKIDESSEVFSNKAVLENHLCIGNFGGYPSITIPNGFIDGLPVGVNITCNCYEDQKTLNLAYALEGTMDYKNQIAKEVK